MNFNAIVVFMLVVLGGAIVLGVMMNELGYVQDQRTQLEAQLAEAQARIRDMEAREVQLKEQLVKAQNRVGQLEAENIELRNALNAASAHVNQLQGQVRDLRAGQDPLMAELVGLAGLGKTVAEIGLPAGLGLLVLGGAVIGIRQMRAGRRIGNTTPGRPGNPARARTAALSR